MEQVRNSLSKLFLLCKLRETHAGGLFGITWLSLVYRLCFTPSTKMNMSINLSILIIGLVITKFLSKGKSIPSQIKPNLQGKTIIITGGNTGIGKETAAKLASFGGKVIIACRTKQKALEAIKELKLRNSELDIEFRELDLSSFQSMENFIENWKEQKSTKLDILINNAGVMMCPYNKTKEGIELQFGTNHVGHFYLTKLLLPFIQSDGRIINLSSLGHIGSPSKINWENFAFDCNSYDPTLSYAISKLANIYFTLELKCYLKEFGDGSINAYSVHPGVVRTELTRHFNSFITLGFFTFGWFLFKSPFYGAQTSIYCAIAPKEMLHDGLFFADCSEILPSQQARDTKHAKHLWYFTERIISSK